MARRTARVCCIRGCPGTVTRLGRCDTHARAHDIHQRNTVPTKRIRNYKEQRMRKDAVNAWVARHGYVCPGYGVPSHTSYDLTYDHTIPVARGWGRGVGGGTPTHTVYCRSCNSRKNAN